MSKLLLDEQPLQVLPCLAVEVGLNEAIALQQLHWVLENPKMGKDVDGMKYVHMTYAEWRIGHFPFWSESTIQRTFSSLVEKGLVKSRDDLNSLSFDRTKWYAIDHSKVEAIERNAQKNSRVVEHVKMKDAHVKMGNASCQNGGTIPDTSSPDTSAPETSGERECGQKPPARPPEGEQEKAYKKRVESAVQEWQKRMDKEHAAAVADPRVADRQFIKRFAPLIARAMGRSEPISEDRSVARDIREFRCDEGWLIERLEFYELDGEFTRPSEDGKQPNAYWLRNRIEREWSKDREERRHADNAKQANDDYAERCRAAANDPELSAAFANLPDPRTLVGSLRVQSGRVDGVPHGIQGVAQRPEPLAAP